jgi:hypothetical protein
MERDSGSRRVLYVALAVAILWGAWCLVHETTGFPGLNYLAFGFVSLPGPHARAAALEIERGCAEIVRTFKVLSDR